MNSFDPDPDVRSIEMIQDELRCWKLELETSAHPPGLGRRSRANPGSEIREPEGCSGFQ
ncbi:MAG: hypothetical protein HYU36_22400 [Planctomycetes bacterium]|nr:hypothetical protein [Planctomycetota bacterium]